MMGFVSVESTKLDGMNDYLEIESGHSMMRYNGKVAQQTIYFLEKREFLREQCPQ